MMHSEQIKINNLLQFTCGVDGQITAINQLLKCNVPVVFNFYHSMYHNLYNSILAVLFFKL